MVKALEPRNYKCVTDPEGLTHKGHVDQIRSQGFQFRRDFELLNKPISLSPNTTNESDIEISINYKIVDVSDKRLSEDCQNEIKTNIREVCNNDIVRRSSRIREEKRPNL